eukprot:1677497-Rhodomonas_salina.1
MVWMPVGFQVLQVVFDFTLYSDSDSYSPASRCQCCGSQARASTSTVTSLRLVARSSPNNLNLKYHQVHQCSGHG